MNSSAPWIAMLKCTQYKKATQLAKGILDNFPVIS